MSDLIERLERWGKDEGLQNHFIGSRSARRDCEEAAAALAEAQAEIARLRGLLIEERTETLWNAYSTGHEKDGMWDHCCMSDGEWLVAECGLPPSQRVYSAEAIKAAIPIAAARAALSRPHATKGEVG